MKRYEYRLVAALVILFMFLTMCTSGVQGAPYSSAAGKRSSSFAQRRRHQNVINDLQCTETKSYFFRSQCSDNGYLTVHRNKVLVQTTGLSEQHEQAEFVVELCTRRNSSWTEDSYRSNSIMTETRPVLRYKHKQSNRYICFSKRGRVRVSTQRRVGSRGSLCMFRQVPVDSVTRYEDKTYHRLQSVHNKKWHLGFNHKSSSLTHIIGTHKGALPRHGKYFDPRKCDFKFFAGEVRQSQVLWSGLDNLIRDSKISKYVSKAAISEVGMNSNELSVDVNKNSILVSDKTKISKAHKDALHRQQALYKQRQRKIRHFKHKRPRLSRQEKNSLKALRRKQPMSKSHKI